MLRRVPLLSLLLLPTALALGCPVPPATDAGEPEPAAEPDAPADAGEPDTPADAGEPDAPADAGEPDAPADGGEPDSPTDGGEPDAPADGGEPDAPADGGEPDAPADGGPPPTDGGPTPPDGGPTPTDGGSTPTDGGPTPTDGGPAPTDAGPVVGSPDLTITPQGFAPSVRVEEQFFFDGSCQVTNGCVGGSGARKILDYAVLVKNIGDRDLRLGDPTTSALFQTDVCSGQPVWREAARWEVLDGAGDVVMSGLHGTTCLEDGAGLVNCSAQGLSIDEADLQPDGTACPLADLTDLASGDYTIAVTWDPLEMLEDSDRTNNSQSTSFVHDGCNGVVCGGICCPADKCVGDVCQLPDIFVDQATLQSSVSIQERTFSEASCAVFEGCVAESGDRRLLRFSTETPNTGNADLFMGTPAGNDLFEFSECHNHYHFEEYADYRLIDVNTGAIAATGHKQAFCLIDLSQYTPGAGPPQYNCGFQGITQGWSDIYSSGLDCQWVDITGVAAGEYFLEVEVNPERIFQELDYTNNTTRIQVTIPPDGNACIPGPEVCGDGLDQDCDNVPDNGCEPLTGLDTCLDAVDLTSTGVFQVDIDAANTADLASTCGGATGRDVFFRLITASEEVVYLSTYGSEIDVTLTILPDDCNPAAAVDCSDDGCGQTGSHFAAKLDPGQYYVQVKAKNPGDVGQVQLKVQRSFCFDGDPIDATGQYSGDTSIDSVDDNRPEACTGAGGTGADDLWYFTTCPGPQNVEFSTCGAGFDTMLEIREGTCAGSEAVVCDDDANEGGQCQLQSRLTATVESAIGEGDGVWFLVVDGYNADDIGPYTVEAVLP